MLNPHESEIELNQMINENNIMLLTEIIISYQCLNSMMEKKISYKFGRF